LLIYVIYKDNYIYLCVVGGTSLAAAACGVTLLTTGVGISGMVIEK